MRSIPLRLWALVLLSALLQLLPFPLAGPVPLWRRLFCWFCLAPLLFALVTRVDWAAVAPLAAGLFFGSLAGPWVARRLPPAVLRWLVAVCGLALAIHLWLAPAG